MDLIYLLRRWRWRHTRRGRIGNGYHLTDLPCGCQDVTDRHGHVVDREHDHVQCDGTPWPGYTDR